MNDTDCTPGREPRSVAASSSLFLNLWNLPYHSVNWQGYGKAALSHKYLVNCREKDSYYRTLIRSHTTPAVSARKLINSYLHRRFVS